jgi:hypothetical protein
MAERWLMRLAVVGRYRVVLGGERWINGSRPDRQLALLASLLLLPLDKSWIDVTAN